MNDLVLTALINLFALFCTSSNLKRERAKSVIYNYLVRFFGIRNYQEYLDLYDTLCDVYELSLPDEEKTVSQVCERLKNEIPEETQALMVLRLMEFSSQGREAYRSRRYLFRLIAAKFGVGEGMFARFEQFISGLDGQDVGMFGVEGMGQLRLLRLREYNRTIVSYDGDEQLFMNDIPMLKGIFMPWEKNGIIKSRRGAALYYSFVDRALLGGAGHECHLHFAGRDVDFRFPGSDNGLHNFTFNLHAGELVAIMGGSGTGKSTLMNILAGSLRPDSGSITVDGRELYDNLESLKPLIGFVPQDDLLIAELTVYQNLLYTARFCFDGMTRQEQEERINRTLQDLDLMPIKDLKVGSPLNKTISGGQRKRLNIALELIREPRILFLDEPTSGLSSADSEKVVHLLKNQTNQGRLVITCIHQPSSDIYKLFDCLWLLDRGGYPIYDGNPIEAISHFKTAANYADAEAAICPTCGNINPEIILSIVEARALDSNGQFTDRRKVEPQEWASLAPALPSPEESGVEQEAFLPGTGNGTGGIKRPGAVKQFIIYLRRNLHTKMQDRQFLLIALLEAPLLALVVSLLTRYSGDEGYTLYENKNLLSYVFMAIIVSVFMGMSGCAEEIFKDRALLKRESFLQLSYSSYIFSKVVTAALIAMVQTFLFIVVGNTLLGIRCLLIEWWAVMFVSSFLAGLTGLILSQRMRSLVAIYITIPLLLIPQILLCGVVVTFDDLNRHSTTRNVPLIGEVIPSRWAFEALAVTMFADNDYSCRYFENERRQYELQMARMGYIRVLDEAVEKEWVARRQKSEGYGSSFAMIQDETARLARRWNITPFALSSRLDTAAFDAEAHAAIKDWLRQADNQLYRASLAYTRAIDRDKKDFIARHGSKALVNLKYGNTNKQLEMTLVNTSASRMAVVEGDVIVPQMGTVYLDPPQRYGRAPFYSSVKLVGPLRVPTLVFNLMVLSLMCVGAIVVLKHKRSQ